MYQKTCTVGITLTNTKTNRVYYNKNDLTLKLNVCYNMNFQFETTIRYVNSNEAWR